MTMNADQVDALTMVPGIVMVPGSHGRVMISCTKHPHFHGCGSVRAVWSIT